MNAHWGIGPLKTNMYLQAQFTIPYQNIHFYTITFIFIKQLKQHKTNESVVKYNKHVKDTELSIILPKFFLWCWQLSWRLAAFCQFQLFSAILANLFVFAIFSLIYFSFLLLNSTNRYTFLFFLYVSFFCHFWLISAYGYYPFFLQQSYSIKHWLCSFAENVVMLCLKNVNV